MQLWIDNREDKLKLKPLSYQLPNCRKHGCEFDQYSPTPLHHFHHSNETGILHSHIIRSYNVYNKSVENPTLHSSLHGKYANISNSRFCLLYTSDAADDLLCVDLGGRR